MVTFLPVCLQERQKQLESLGISLQSSGIKVGDDKCFLVNLNADPALNELLVYYLKVKTQTTEATRLVCVDVSNSRKENITDVLGESLFQGRSLAGHFKRLLNV